MIVLKRDHGIAFVDLGSKVILWTAVDNHPNRLLHHPNKPTPTHEHANTLIPEPQAAVAAVVAHSHKEDGILFNDNSRLKVEPSKKPVRKSGFGVRVLAPPTDPPKNRSGR